jgi:phosphoglucomutase
MEVSTDAGKPAKPAMLVNVPGLITAYFEEVPDPSMPEQQVLLTECSGNYCKNESRSWRYLQ